MYIIEPNREADKALANVTNRIERHCRIGKVRIKTGVKWMDSPFPYVPPRKAEPVIWRGDQNAIPWWMHGPWCNQAVQ